MPDEPHSQPPPLGADDDSSQTLSEESSQTFSPSPRPRAPFKERVRQWFRDLVRYSRPREPPPPRGNHLDRAVYGAAQPLLGLRLVFSSWDIFREAILPVSLLAAVCAAYAFFAAHPYQGRLLPFAHGSLWMGRLKEFYVAFALLASAPPVIFANHYARFAAQVRFHLGFGPCGPREMPLRTSIRRALQQYLVGIAAVAPFVAAARLLPLVGGSIVWTITSIWLLNWVVLDAFDDANVLQPGQTLADVERESETLRRPWFVRLLRGTAELIPQRWKRLLRLARWFAAKMDQLSKPWREESALLEASPRLGLGFALSTFAMLAAPVLNLLFRPVIIAGATHLLGHIEQEQHAESPELLHAQAPPEEQERKAKLGERFPQLGKRFNRD